MLQKEYLFIINKQVEESWELGCCSFKYRCCTSHVYSGAYVNACFLSLHIALPVYRLYEFEISLKHLGMILLQDYYYCVIFNIINIINIQRNRKILNNHIFS